MIFNFFVFFFLSFLVGVVIYLMNFLSMKNFNKNELIYSIESGFLSYKNVYFLFNLSFFVILLLFVLFDIELIFVIFFPFMKVNLNFELFIISFFIFFTLWIEWKMGKILWY